MNGGFKMKKNEQFFRGVEKRFSRFVCRTDLSLCTQQECLFRGDGVVPLVSVTLLHARLCSVRSTLNIYRQEESNRRAVNGL